MAGPSRDVPPRGREKGVLVERFFSREGKYLPLVLRLRVAFLAVLVALSFALPLSRPERGVLIPAAGILAGLNWAILDQVKRR